MALPTAATADRPFVIQLEEFSGPLDLLLHLIREQEIEITDIPIGRIADQFLAVIHVLRLNQAAEYLEMAAYLLRIKILMLLPLPLDAEEWEDPRAELVRRLLEYEQIREVVDWMLRRAGERADRFPRGVVPEPPELLLPPAEVSVDQLLQAAERLVELLPARVMHRVVPRPLDTEGATRRIQEVLRERERVELAELLGEGPTVTDIISVLIALLELARLGAVGLSQADGFGPILITRATAHEAA
ncbi:MAG: segregation/condensation protein A [Gemmatimonadetes bacterium]|nr:segregation/condensation protein A [Gemmatimonadota bacterium]